MPDVQEVFRMATQKVRPEPGFVDRQLDNQRRRSRNRRAGAYVLAVAIGVVAVGIVIRTAGDGMQTQPGIQPSPTSAVVPDVDYMIDLETGAMTPLPAAIVGEADETEAYALSPDGSMLAYMGPGDEGGNNQIFVANLDGSGVRQVSHDPRGTRFAAWSPDGAAIAYEGYGSRDVRNLFVVDVETGASTQVTFEDADVFGTQYSPDGSSIVYAGGTPGSGIRLAPIGGGKHTLLVGGGGDRGDAGNGSLSPDGSLLTYAFSETPGAPPERWVANADGSDPRPLVQEGGFLECHPPGTWSPDGSRIACSDGLVVVVVDVESGEVTTVAEGSYAIWLDDHTLLVNV